MRARDVLAILLIFFASAIAWAILGSTILRRTYSAGNGLGPRSAPS